MNFFALQDQARRSTHGLVVLFVLAVIAVVAAVDGVAWLVMAGRAPLPPGQAQPVLLWASAATLALILLSTLYRVFSLSGGGSVVAKSLGAVPVPPDVRDPKLKQLRNVVEEIAIASGVPVPELFVLEGESGINAFAAGYSPSDAAITVTRGCLDQLDRDELQGVIAHEYSHILNGDMRLNLRLIGILFGLLVLALVGRRVMAGASRTRGNGAAGAALAGLAVMIVGYVGVLFGNLIKAAVARSRERLADASAVQFTRQSTGLAGALKKIAAGAGSRLQATEADEVSHMLFAEGLASRLFATHPPLEERIRALEPGFSMERFLAEPAARKPAPPQSQAASAKAAGGFPLPRAGALSAAIAVARAGKMEQHHVAHGAVLRQAIPEALDAAARDAQHALPLLFALLLDGDETIRARQLERVTQDWGAELSAASTALQAQTAALAPALRLPLATLALPALRRRPPAELARCVQTLSALARADGRVQVFEYALGTLVRAVLTDVQRPSAQGADAGLGLPELRDDIVLLFSVMAAAGAGDLESAARAFEAGLAQVLPDARRAYESVPGWPDRLDAALARLDRLPGAAKQRLVAGLAHTVAADGQVAVAEYELLRAVCGALHTPLPPLTAT